jgi:hypothetical protein
MRVAAQLARHNIQALNHGREPTDRRLG